MTYEKFVENMTSEDNSITRKSIKGFVIKYALLLFLNTLSLTMVITNIAGGILSLVFLVLSLFLYIWSFDLLVENPKYFERVNKLAKFWWLITPIVFILCILINLFIF